MERCFFDYSRFHCFRSCWAQHRTSSALPGTETSRRVAVRVVGRTSWLTLSAGTQGTAASAWPFVIKNCKGPEIFNGTSAPHRGSRDEEASWSLNAKSAHSSRMSGTDHQTRLAHFLSVRRGASSGDMYLSTGFAFEAEQILESEPESPVVLPNCLSLSASESSEATCDNAFRYRSLFGILS